MKTEIGSSNKVALFSTYKFSYMIMDTGVTAERFLHHTSNLDGTSSPIYQGISENTKNRKYWENSIKGAAVKNGTPLDTIVTNIFCAYPDYLDAYIIAHGETPLQNPIQKGIQATLIRAKDIATQTTSTNGTDELSLESIEQAEQGSQDINAPDSNTVLPLEVQGAMKVAMDHISDLCISKGWDGSMTQAFNYMNAQASAAGLPSNADGDSTDTTDVPVWDPSYGTADPTASPILSGLATIPVSTGTINPSTGMPTINVGPAPSTDTAGLVSMSNNNSGVLAGITSILSGVTSAANSVKTAANAATQAGGAVTNLKANVGASSLQQYISKNWPMILGIVLAMIIIVFILGSASRKK